MTITHVPRSGPTADSVGALVQAGPYVAGIEQELEKLAAATNGQDMNNALAGCSTLMSLLSPAMQKALGGFFSGVQTVLTTYTQNTTLSLNAGGGVVYQLTTDGAGTIPLTAAQFESDYASSKGGTTYYGQDGMLKTTITCSELNNSLSSVIVTPNATATAALSAFLAANG